MKNYIFVLFLFIKEFNSLNWKDSTWSLMLIIMQKSSIVDCSKWKMYNLDRFNWLFLTNNLIVQHHHLDRSIMSTPSDRQAPMGF